MARTRKTTAVPEVPAAAPLADGELAELIRTKLACEERHTAELERLARIAAQTQAALIVEIQAAGQAGLTNRAISRASGLSHPTVAKILADPAKYGGQAAS
jgi:DNA invertase Pin-like site-specific DNA recombinase